MGPPPDADTMLNMLENPQFQSTLNEALQNPAMIDMMIQQNPMLRDMGPGVRQMMQSPEFRRMLTDPNSIRQMMQMQRAMGGFGGGAGGSAFPAPGVTNTTPEENRGAQQEGQPQQQTAAPSFNPFMIPPNFGTGNPFAALFGGNPNLSSNAATGSTATGGNQTESAGRTDGPAGTDSAQPPQNPFGFLSNPALFGVPPTAPGQGGQAGQPAFNPFDPQHNPFLRNPALLQQIMQGAGGMPGEQGAGVNPLAALFGGGGGGSPVPPDNRPPEERYADQLRQLNDMGFFEFERNVEALRRSGGSVQGAVEYLLSHPS